jgi:hypothetical protein
MIILCPFCGHKLPLPLNSGISSCVNCNRVFDSSKNNFLLSTAWLVRKRNISDPQYLIDYIQSSKEDAEFVINHIFEKCCSHEDFLNIIQEKY